MNFLERHSLLAMSKCWTTCLIMFCLLLWFVLLGGSLLVHPLLPRDDPEGKISMASALLLAVAVLTGGLASLIGFLTAVVNWRKIGLVWRLLGVLPFLLLLAAMAGRNRVVAAEPPAARSHPPMRPLPTASKQPFVDGPKLFVDAARGDDANAGTAQAPWKTLAHALRRLKPGDTLYLRGGTYYEKVSLSRSGTAEAPITIASHPGELAVIDGGLREFLDSPATAWEPFPGGAEGEFVSTRAYPHVDDRKVPHQFLPAAWEPLWGIEDERPLALGHFADSLVPLHGYRTATDLRATNEFWRGKKETDATGIYCGPGLWFNRETGRIHIRLAHHRLAGLGDMAYRGETDPRKLPLVVAAGFGDDVLRVCGVRHVRLQGLVLRSATGSPLIHVYGSEHVDLDRLTVFGGFPALLVNASKNVRVTHSAFRGLAAPWTSRAHMKYRGTASYQIILHNNQPVNENLEFAWCEFTDDHDFAFLRFVKNLQFHHNFVDNFNDDGLEVGPKLRAHTLFIHQNRIGRCLIPLTQHEMDKDESPVDHDPKAGVFVFRNVIDLRGGTYKSPPTGPDATGAFLREEGHLAGDHGGPTWPVLRIYHNTMLRHTPVFRDQFLFGLGAMGLRNTERDVFNNLFVQTNRVPGVNFVGMKQAANLREGGNLLWGLKDGPALQGDPFAKFRASALFRDSRQRYEPGWTTHDRVADPRFVRLPAGESPAADLRLQAGQSGHQHWPGVAAGMARPPAHGRQGGAGQRRAAVRRGAVGRRRGRAHPPFWHRRWTTIAEVPAVAALCPGTLKTAEHGIFRSACIHWRSVWFPGPHRMRIHDTTYFAPGVARTALGRPPLAAVGAAAARSATHYDRADAVARGGAAADCLRGA